MRKQRGMRLIFCGTPDYAVPSLQALLTLAPRHEVVGVVSQPDKAKGRSAVPTPPPVVAAALAAGIPRERIFQPRSINKPEVLASLRALAPDLLCVVAYGNLLKQEALALPRLYCINAHASLLPKYRGAAPIQAALLNGDAETGVCIMKMELGLDSGPVMSTHRVPIAPDDTAGTLHDKLAELSARAFVDAVELIAENKAIFVPQNEAAATHVGKIEKNAGRVDWNKSAAEIERLVRAMSPWPGAWTTVARPDGGDATRVRLVRVAAAPMSTNVAGKGRASGDAFVVDAGAGAVKISELQPEGRKPMSAAEFLRGAGKKYEIESRWS